MNTLSNKGSLIATPHRVTQCSYCMSPNIVRIPSPKIVKSLFSWVPLEHFLCYGCMNKQYKFKKFHHK